MPLLLQTQPSHTCTPSPSLCRGDLVGALRLEQIYVVVSECVGQASGRDVQLSASIRLDEVHHRHLISVLILVVCLELASIAVDMWDSEEVSVEIGR
jgi:hypothetical protein